MEKAFKGVQKVERHKLKKPPLASSSVAHEVNVGVEKQTKNIDLGQNLRAVIEHLRTCGVENPQSLEQLEASIKEIKGDVSLVEEMRINPKISYSQGLYSYKPVYDVRSKDELRKFLKSKHQVYNQADFHDCFKGAKEAIEELKKSGEILEYKTGERFFMYYFDPAFAIPMDTDFLKLYQEIRVPEEDTLKKVISQAKLFKEIKDEDLRKVMDKKKNKRRMKVNRNYNNHLEGSNQLSREFERN